LSQSRRQFIKTGTGLAAQALWTLGSVGCGSGRPEPRLLSSYVPLPAKFTKDLPLLNVLQPSSQENGIDQYDLSAKTGIANILPGFKTRIWGFDGSFPGPTIEARSGRKVVVRLQNELPVPIVNHLHGGKTPPQSDGYPTDLLLPKQGWAGRTMHDPLAKVVIGTRDYVFPNEQRAATLWYHDHRMDFTGPQIWRGLAGMYIIRDDEEERLPLPKGDKEISLFICDRSFAADGSLLYPSLDHSLIETPGVDADYMGGVLGDVMLVNGIPWPNLQVANTRYRFRILNACNARHLELTLSPQSKMGASFTQIGSDGGLLGAPVQLRRVSIAPAERFDVVIDFSQFDAGTKVVLRNADAHDETNEIMRFDIVRHERDESNIPAKLCDFERLTQEMAQVTRRFDFSYAGMKRGWSINGQAFDPMRMDAEPKLGTTEIWRLRSDFHHPVHLHMAHFQVLTHSGHPRPYDAGWKDTVDLVAGETANVLVKFEGYRGRYVFHCHNLEHEDMAMMGNFTVV
jgi:spore coat protein A, manganese oxidase